MTNVQRTILLAMLGAAVAVSVQPAIAQNKEQVRVVFDHVIPNVPGKRMVAAVVTYPPLAKSAAHHHAPSAFIYAHVLSGIIRSQVDGGSVKLYHPGEGFYEAPGSHHTVSENASDTERASLLAVFIVDSKDKPLTIPDQKQQPNSHEGQPRGASNVNN
jgi:quercetin dioxygenase-like cupin family protein